MEEKQNGKTPFATLSHAARKQTHHYQEKLSESSPRVYLPFPFARHLVTTWRRRAANQNLRHAERGRERRGNWERVIFSCCSHVGNLIGGVLVLMFFFFFFFSFIFYFSPRSIVLDRFAKKFYLITLTDCRVLAPQS